MNFKDYLTEIESITEMANLSQRDHNIPNIKMNVRQPGKDKYPHDVSVKIFSKSLDDALVIIINRNTGELTEITGTPKWLKTKKKKAILEFVSSYYENFVKLWDDPSLAIDDLNWSK